MQLIGMLDSPYVRRVAVSLQLLGVPFEHRSVSVFRGFAEFAAINPVVKAPTLVCDDGTRLMDSNLILEYAQALAAPGKSLTPTTMPERLRSLQLTGLALAACEKSVQIVYEHLTRPAEKWHAPWLERITAQLQAACEGLETELTRQPVAMTRASIDRSGVSIAVTWRFIRAMTPEVVPVASHPRLAALSAAAEQLPEFIAAPHGESVYRAA